MSPWPDISDDKKVTVLFKTHLLNDVLSIGDPTKQAPGSAVIDHLLLFMVTH